MKNASESVLDAIIAHCQSEISVEVGGLLIGDLITDGVTIVASIPALAAQAGTANVTFTHEVWDGALGLVERDYPAHRIVGWYHTHPRFGVFMSNYDEFIQVNFFPDERMPGLVVDPVSGECGVFKVRDGVVVQTESFEIEPVSDTKEVAQQRTIHARQARGRWVLVVPFLLLVGLIAGIFVGGGLSTPVTTTTPTPTSTTLPSTTACSITITVTPGMSYWMLSEILLGTGLRYHELQSQTGGARLYAGQRLTLSLPTCLNGGQ